MEIKIPKKNRGRQTPEKIEQYEADLGSFADAILNINSTLSFRVSSRGWCYILEEHGLLKGDFNTAQRVINDCRKSGLLPIDITAVDQNRVASCIQEVDFDDPEAQAQYAIDSIENYAWQYIPKAFWEYQDCYVEMFVEKIDLKSLFEPICKRYHIPLTNARGWSDIHSRAAMMKRFTEWENKGKQCVLLYCGDHDPGGLNISETILSNLYDLDNAVGMPFSLEVDRFGLNFDFIQANSLSWVDNLETSSGGRLDSPKHRDHYKPYVQSYLAQYGARKVEANALVTRAKAGRKLCKQAILKYVDADMALEYDEYIDEQQEQVRDLIVQKMEAH